MNSDYPRIENIAIPSSGDDQRDREELERFILREKRLIEGICPNDCGELKPEGDHALSCPKCGFHYWSNTPLKAIR